MNNVINEKKFITSRLGVPYDSLSQSYLRAETALGTLSTIKFALQQGKTTSPLVTERLLQLNDQFVITHFFIGIKQIASDTPTATQQLTTILQTYPDPQIFSGTNAANIGAVYNSSLNFTIDRKEYLPNFPVRAFLRIPQFQTNGLLLTPGTVGSPVATYSGNKGINAFDNGLFGFYPCEPTIIDGRQTLDVNIELNTSVAFDDSSNTVYAVFEARGYLIVNAKS